jgi:glycosyltransferase involved in cell wall biosynthesis
VSAARVERQGPRLLLITGLWPTSDAPSAGIFVKRRAAQLDSPTIIAPHSYRGSTAGRYLALAVRALTARGRFDGVEVHWLFPTGLIGLLAARLRGIPFVVYAHGDDVVMAPNRNVVYRRLAALICSTAAAVVTNSRATAAYIEALGRTARVISPAVDRNRFRPSPRPSQTRVLYLGGVAPEKGYDVARDFADTLLGPGIDERRPDEIPQLIAEHDVVLIPSRRESFGLAAAEAISSGRWVVASAVGGLVDVVTDGVNGTLVSDGDFQAALEGVPTYDPEAVSASGARFDAGIEEEAFAALWVDVLAKRRGRS